MCLVSGILDAIGDESIFVDERKCLFGGLFISDDDLGGVETHSDQIFSVTEELSSESDCKVGCVSALFVLHFASEHEHLGGWVLDFELNGG